MGIEGYLMSLAFHCGLGVGGEFRFFLLWLEHVFGLYVLCRVLL